MNSSALNEEPSMIWIYVILYLVMIPFGLEGVENETLRAVELTSSTTRLDTAPGAAWRNNQ